MALSLLLVGCGKMGSAMLEGWLSSGIVDSGYVVEPSGRPADADPDRIGHVAVAADLPADFAPDVVVLAVKPQMMDAALADYRRFVSPGTLFVSIAAGKTVAYFLGHLGDQARIVRAMPNTPAAVGRGITAMVAGPGVSSEQAESARRLLEAVGEVVAVDDEALMDVVTAVSGGGPAYVFLLMEALSAAGQKAGLSVDVADRLARVTVSGAGELAHRSDQPAATLRENVTSPGGTTLEALNVLMDDESGIQSLFDRAIDAATRRSRELAD